MWTHVLPRAGPSEWVRLLWRKTSMLAFQVQDCHVIKHIPKDEYDGNSAALVVGAKNVSPFYVSFFFSSLFFFPMYILDWNETQPTTLHTQFLLITHMLDFCWENSLCNRLEWRSNENSSARTGELLSVWRSPCCVCVCVCCRELKEAVKFSVFFCTLLNLCFSSSLLASTSLSSCTSRSLSCSRYWLGFIWMHLCRWNSCRCTILDGLANIKMRREEEVHHVSVH